MIEQKLNRRALKKIVSWGDGMRKDIAICECVSYNREVLKKLINVKEK